MELVTREEDGVVKQQQEHHLVLVHGACHGAWCWFKLKPLLEATGHRVTALNMSASGNKIEEVGGYWEYNLPLLHFMDSLPPGEQVILVGHSLGGMNISLAADEYPHKVSLAVYITAFLPDTVNSPAYPVEKYFVEATPVEAWSESDIEFEPSENSEVRNYLFIPLTCVNVKINDVELGKQLIRSKNSLFKEDLGKLKPLSREGYGSVNRVYIKCLEDLTITKEFQGWLVQNAGVSLVKEMADADHMPMISNPLLLSQVIQQVLDEVFV